MRNQNNNKAKVLTILFMITLSVGYILPTSANPISLKKVTDEKRNDLSKLDRIMTDLNGTSENLKNSIADAMPEGWSEIIEMQRKLDELDEDSPEYKVAKRSYMKAVVEYASNNAKEIKKMTKKVAPSLQKAEARFFNMVINTPSTYQRFRNIINSKSAGAEPLGLAFIYIVKTRKYLNLLENLEIYSRTAEIQVKYKLLEDNFNIFKQLVGDSLEFEIRNNGKTMQEILNNEMGSFVNSDDVLINENEEDPLEKAL